MLSKQMIVCQYKQYRKYKLSDAGLSLLFRAGDSFDNLVLQEKYYSCIDNNFGWD